MTVFARKPGNSRVILEKDEAELRIIVPAEIRIHLELRVDLYRPGSDASPLEWGT